MSKAEKVVTSFITEAGFMGHIGAVAEAAQHYCQGLSILRTSKLTALKGTRACFNALVMLVGRVSAQTRVKLIPKLSAIRSEKKRR
ncbi:MAG: hypothetical protein IPI14_08355 [Polaromonas sp.]|nr:hypothetical protein [Polaromonas sp.]